MGATGRLMVAVLATAALISLASPALAREVRSGYWTVFDTEGNAENKPLCGMRTQYGDVQASIYIKYVLGEKHLIAQVFKAGWRFPEKPIAFPVTLGFDDGIYGSTTALGSNVPGVGPMMEFNIANGATDSFLTAFGTASRRI